MTVLATPPARFAAGALCLALVATGTGLLPVAGMVPLTAPPPTPIHAHDHPTGPARPAASGSLAGIDLAAKLSQAVVVREGSRLVVQCTVDVRDDAVETGTKRPIDLALVLDTSGSMEGAMSLLKQATLGIVNRLGPQDRITVVTYSNAARVIYRGVPRAEGSGALEQAVAALYASGGTNLSAGLDLAAQALQQQDTPICRGRVSDTPERCSEQPLARQKRILLLTDGLANQGITDGLELRARVQAARSGGVALSSLGLGSEFNEMLLGDLADAGGGMYHYVDAAAKLDAVYKAEVEALQGVVATNAAVRLVPAPGVTIERVHSWPSRTDGGATVVPVGDLARGRALKVMVHLRLDTAAAGLAVRDVVRVALAFRSPETAALHELAPDPLSVSLTADPRVAAASADPALSSELTRLEVADRLARARSAAEAGRVEEAQSLVQECKQIAGADAIEFEAPSGEPVRLEFDALADQLDAGAAAPAARAALKQSMQAERQIAR